MDRATFLRWMGALIGGSVLGDRILAGMTGTPRTGGHTASAPLPTRRLGRAGVELPILGLGGWHVGSVASERAARTLVETALAEGIRFLDTAESYQSGKSERWIGSAMASLGVRRNVFLMTKTFDLATRSRESAQRHLEGSLRRLQTDHLDLWQLHSVRTVADVDRAFRRGGAMEYIIEMQRQGVVKHIGVTGHQDPAANLRALHHWDEGMTFDTMQMPLNPVDYHQHSFQRLVLPALVERDIGVLAMKTAADGRLLRNGICTAAECRAFAWSLPVAVAVVGMERPALVRENARFARDFRPLSDAERRALLARVAPRVSMALEPYKERSA
jgi:aryl-alcohol dehydrogenase-like predicted oxidoreductase